MRAPLAPGEGRGAGCARRVGDRLRPPGPCQLDVRPEGNASQIRHVLDCAPDTPNLMSKRDGSRSGRDGREKGRRDEGLEGRRRDGRGTGAGSSARAGRMPACWCSPPPPAPSLTSKQCSSPGLTLRIACPLPAGTLNRPRGGSSRAVRPWWPATRSCGGRSAAAASSRWRCPRRSRATTGTACGTRAPDDRFFSKAHKRDDAHDYEVLFEGTLIRASPNRRGGRRQQVQPTLPFPFLPLLPGRIRRPWPSAHRKPQMGAPGR